MGQNNSGKNKSQRERLEQVKTILDKYQKQNGLLLLSYNDDVAEYLSMDRQTIASMTAESCGEIAYLLNCYSLFLQKEYNRQRAYFEWSQNAINELVAKEAENYGYGKKDSFLKYDYVVEKIGLNNEAVKTLKKINSESKIKKIELEEIANRVSVIANDLKSIQYNKGKTNNV